MKNLARWLFIKYYYTELGQVAKSTREKRNRVTTRDQHLLGEIKGTLDTLSTLDLLL